MTKVPPPNLGISPAQAWTRLRATPPSGLTFRDNANRVNVDRWFAACEFALLIQMPRLWYATEGDTDRKRTNG